MVSSSVQTQQNGVSSNGKRLSKKRIIILVISALLILAIVSFGINYFVIKGRTVKNIEENIQTLMSFSKEQPSSDASDVEVIAQQDQITRGELAVYLLNAFDVSLVNTSKQTFADVSKSSSEYQAIETFVAKNITTGCASDPLRYCPERVATRAEAVTFLIRILGLPINLDPNFRGYSDIENHPLEQYVQYAGQIGMGLVCDKDKNMFCPDDPITGEQLRQLVSEAKFVVPTSPMRWIQPNYHPDKLTVWETAYEYPELWDNTFKNIDVLGLFIYAIDANPHNYLDKVATVVKKYNLKVSVELSGLMETTSCDDQKGEQSAALTLKLLKPLYDRGIKVDYLAIDGSGVTMISMVGCNNMPLDLATSELVQYIQIVHQTYPDIKMGLLPNFAAFYYEGEPTYWGTESDMPDYYNLFEEILTKIQASGQSIDFVLTDYPYEIATHNTPYGFANSINWTNRLFYLENQVERHGIKFGVIFNSEGQNHESTNKEFFTNTINYKSLYKSIGGTPDIMMIESWYSYPDLFVPDNTGYTFTNLAANFFGYPVSQNSRILTRRDAAEEIVKLFNIGLQNPSNVDFADVPTTDSGYSQIETMYLKGLTTGCASDPFRFCPDRQLTRAEAITFLLRASGVNISLKNTVKFNDVYASFALYQYVIFAAENGISMGCNSNGNFCPNDVITLGEWENLSTKILNYYYSTKTCSLISRCSTAYGGQSISYIPDPRSGCYDFKLFPIYPIWSYRNNCPGSYSKSGRCTSYVNCICKQYVPCCTIDQGLNGKLCK